MNRPMLTTAVAALLAACGGVAGNAQQAATPGGPLETRAPNAKDQQPAFPGQTRAPAVVSNVALNVSTVAEGLDKPWGLAFLPDGRLLVTEKAGRLRIIRDGKLSEPIAGVPTVDARGQGGLLGLAVDPAFARNGFVYLSFSEPQADGTNNTAVARGKLVTDASGVTRLDGTKTIWSQKPAWKSVQHYGGRLVFARDGTLFVATGDRSVLTGRAQAQDPASGIGKMIRINADGSIPRNNPFVGKAGVQPEIWSIGHRNIQSLAVHPRTGDIWEVEHGTRGGDELNRVQKGKDYGWATIAYGVEYAGGKINEGITQKAGMEQPVYYWDPVIAPSGMAFYDADLFPGWKGNLFIGGLASKRLVRLVLNGDKVVGEEHLLADVGERFRDVVVGPDGALYLATDNTKGRVLKVAPKE